MIEIFERELFSFEMLNSLFQSTEGQDQSAASYDLFFKALSAAVQGSIIAGQGFSRIISFFWKDDKA